MRTRLVALFVTLAAASICHAGAPANAESATARCETSSSKQISVATTRSATAPNLKESIDPRYAKRYAEWKNEFLAAEIARVQWDLYAKHPHLTLTITIVPAHKNGAGTGNYKWNEDGELVEATIFLGSRIDQGYPSSVYYPVMNALEPYEQNQLISRNVLAAAKMAHEFGHVMKIAETSEELYKLQLKLVPIYNKIFLSNGHDVNDPRLIDLAQQMGGNPVEIWEDREYWGEANAMLYLRDRMASENVRCRLFNKIKRMVEQYAKRYEERFSEIAKSRGVDYSCSWK